MYESFFGLTSAPFKITPDTRIFFHGGQREQLLSAVLYAIQRGEGLLKVVGEVGSGKTTLLRQLAIQLQQQSMQLVYVNSPNMPPADLLAFICRELGLTYSAEQPRYLMLEQLQQRLLALHSQNRAVVMLVDEAQAMPAETLEELRLLGNLETDTDKLLQIVLFGQPELDLLLARPDVRQVRDRIAFSLQLEPFDCKTLQHYLNFRLRAAGYIGRDLFNAATARRIYRQTKGYPRKVNLLADKVLLAAFTQHQKTISRSALKKAISDHSNNTGVIVPYWKLGGFLLLIVLAVGLYVLKSTTLLPLFHTKLTESDSLVPIEHPAVSTQSQQPLASEQPVLATPTQVQHDPMLMANSAQFWQQYNQHTLMQVESWLSRQQRYTVQLMSVPYGKAQTLFVENADRLSAVQLYSYEKLGQRMVVIVSGHYSTMEQARAALPTVPMAESLPVRAFVRSLADIRDELVGLNRAQVPVLSRNQE